MYPERYNKIKAFITKNKVRLIIFTFVYKQLPRVLAVVYGFLIVYLCIIGDMRVIKCVCVPAFVFATLSAARHALNFERPYEKFDISPIFPKGKKGRSFPSRHTACAAVIAASVMYVSLPVGIAAMVAAVLVALSRVIGGVHFPRDVAAGFLYALVCAAVYLT